MAEQLKKVDHDYIRYANCWEDADILVEALKIEQGDKVLSIASGGDNSFSLLINDPEIVVAIDINIVQLRVVQLKKAAIKALDHEDCLKFLGFQKSKTRLDVFNRLKVNLDEEACVFWENNLKSIDRGIIHTGKFERYFRLFRKWVLPLIHTRKRVNRLFETKTVAQQIEFYTKEWNNRRWRLLFKLFFSRFVMGRLGRDPEFLKQVEIPVSEFIFNKAETHLKSVQCQQNYLLYYIFNGYFSEDYLPHYIRKEHFDRVKKNIDKLETYYGFAEAAFEKHGKFNKFNLSNIFEYMSPDIFRQVGNNILENAENGSRFAYWNLMVDRFLSSLNPSIRSDQPLKEKLSEKDKGFFYGAFNIDCHE